MSSYSLIFSNFYPRPPRGGRPFWDRGKCRSWCISIHALREEGDDNPVPLAWNRVISIHALREEGDILRKAIQEALVISIHALREEGDHAFSVLHKSARLFLSTPSARRATPPLQEVCGNRDISIHALREEGDPGRRCRRGPAGIFLSTPSARRATGAAGPAAHPDMNFYPRPPRGGRRKHDREKGGSRVFLSTPSARRATFRPPWCRCSEADFYPRPPRGGRRRSAQKTRCGAVFLSTPSARRATAKTETKSLFSNKLYNILHEFRRALIYNGSKSYPNHAK